MPRRSFSRTTKYFEILIVIVASPVIIGFSLWSIYGQQIATFNAPEMQTILVLMAADCVALLTLLLRRSNFLAQHIREVLTDVETHGFSQVLIHTGREASKRQVGLMLAMAEEELEKSAFIDILEANLQHGSPKGILKEHKRLVNQAKKNNWSLRWHLIVANRNNEKAMWISQLENDLAVEDIYTIHENRDITPSLNFIVIPSLNQTYFGMGEWKAFDSHSTGGIWIHNRHISDFMSHYFEDLKNYSMP